MEDIKLGRELAPLAFLFLTTQNTWVKCLDADTHRTRIIFGADGANQYFFLPFNPPTGTLTGFLTTPQDPQLLISVEEWGRLVESPWYVFTTVLAGQVPIMTATLMRDK